MGSVKKERPRHKYSGVRWKTNSTNKKYLAIDFKRRCAYCDDHDFYCGGTHNYHVEHFAPKEKFPALKHVYENLLYSCPYCNNAKSDTWPSDNPSVNVVDNEGFINPCSNEYDQHLLREPTGEIIASTELGKYMRNKLKLFLYRHELFFKLEQVEEKKKCLEAIIEKERYEGRDISTRQSALESLNNEFFGYYAQWQSLDE